MESQKLPFHSCKLTMYSLGKTIHKLYMVRQSVPFAANIDAIPQQWRFLRMLNKSERQYHKVANIFPLMQSSELNALAEDIKQHGLVEPIVLHPSDDSIIDGRNRYRACLLAGVEPKFTYWDGKGSLVEYVVSLNLHRRHLSSIQCAGIAVEMLPFLEAEAKERQRLAIARGNDSRHYRTPIVANLPQLASDNACYELSAATISPDEFRDDWVQDPVVAPAPKSRDIAARATNAAPRYVQDMKSYKESAPDVYNMAMEGKINGSQAKELAKLSDPMRKDVIGRMEATGETKVRKVLREVQQRQKSAPPPIAPKGYRVWYADPPWSYGNSGVINDSDGYGRAERHYPTMSIDELCLMGYDIKEACADNAVLFMWVTSPLLEDSFRVINAWGFKYKTSFVWDKVGHNFGHYNSVRHEFLLVCTRGSCTPDEKTLYDSVVEFDKTRKHSEKPEVFRNMIDTLYTHGNRIELFARKAAPGWDVWGNEESVN